MRILILATEDYLGAGKAALRIYKALRKEEHDAYLLVKNKINDDVRILRYGDLITESRYSKFRSLIKRFLSKFKRRIATDKDYYFLNLDGDNMFVDINALTRKLPIIPDVILVTWVSRFLEPEHLYQLHNITKAKIVFYPLDMSILTGGCHYAWTCEGFKTNCTKCPAILDESSKNYPAIRLKEKDKYYSKSEASIVVASDQLLEQARKSFLFRDSESISKALIPIDKTVFNREFRILAKKIFNIPDNSKVIFYGSSFTNEKRKGMRYFVEALKVLHAKYILDERERSNIFILLGGNASDESIKNDIPFNVVFAGYIKDDRLLSIAYQASEVFVSTSVQDSGPMMVNESIMCGTPVVAFQVGVSNDLIKDNVSGYKVESGNHEEIAKALHRILKLNEKEFEQLSISTRNLGLEKTSESVFVQSLIEAI
jgi:glycosyltransferase involved in cell wall biosynthesis